MPCQVSFDLVASLSSHPYAPPDSTHGRQLQWPGDCIGFQKFGHPSGQPAIWRVLHWTTVLLQPARCSDSIVWASRFPGVPHAVLEDTRNVLSCFLLTLETSSCPPGMRGTMMNPESPFDARCNVRALASSLMTAVSTPLHSYAILAAELASFTLGLMVHGLQ